MGFKGSLQSYSLADLFQNVGTNDRTGTLKIIGPKGEKLIYFVEGQIRLLAHGAGKKGLLKKVLVESKLIPEANINEAENAAREKGIPLLNELLERNLIEEQNLKDLVDFAIEEDIYELFTWEEAQFEFVDGAPEDQVFEGELFTDENTFNTSHLVMEAARRSDEWGRIREIITSDDNVFMVINEARGQLETFDPESIALKVVMYVDGYRSVGEVVTASSLGKFDVYEGIFNLYQQGIVRHKTFEELFATGIELKKQGQNQKAIVFLKRALEMQQNVECMRELAQLHETVGNTKDGAEVYSALGKTYSETGDDDSALEAYRKVIELGPDEARAHYEIATILTTRDMVDDAVVEYVQYAEKLLDKKRIQESREICYRILNLKPHNHDAHRLLAKGYLWEGNSESAIAEYKSLAQALLANMKPKQAISEYERILEEECNFPAVKEGVKDFLLKSGEVKTYGLKRLILTLIVLIILGGAGFAAYIYVTQKATYQNAQKDLGTINSEYTGLLDNMQHLDVINKCQNLLEKYPTYKDIVDRAEAIIKESKDSLKKYLEDKLSEIEGYTRKDESEEALIVIKGVLEKYGNTKIYPFVSEEINKVRNFERDVNNKIIGDEISAQYKEAVRKFEAGYWDDAYEVIFIAFLNERIGDIFSDAFKDELRNIENETDLQKRKDFARTIKEKILGSDAHKEIKMHLKNLVTLYSEILSSEDNPKKLFERYIKLKDTGYPPEKLREILDKAASLGSEEAKQVLRDFEEKQAEELAKKAKTLENEGEYEKALLQLKKILRSYGNTKAADRVQLIFLLQTEPEGVYVDVNGRSEGRSDAKKIYRYDPRRKMEIRLHYPTYRDKKQSISDGKAVYLVKMNRGPEQTFQAREGIESEMLIYDDHLFFGDKGGFLYNIAMRDFGNEWQAFNRGNLRFGITAPPFEYRRSIYFGTESGDVIAMSPGNVNPQWTRSLGVRSPVIGFVGIENPIKRNEFLLFAATRAGTIFVLDSSNGEIKNKIALGRNKGIESGLFAHGNSLLFTGDTDGEVVGMDIIDLNSGMTNVLNAREKITSPFVLYDQDVVLFGSKDSRLYAADISGGAGLALKTTTFPTRDWILAKPYIHDGLIYVGGVDHYLYCLTLTENFNLEQKWSYETDDQIVSEPCVIDGVVYVGCANGKLYALEVKDGFAQNKWTYSTEGRIKAGLKSWKNYLLVSDDRGFLYAFKVK